MCLNDFIGKDCETEIILKRGSQIPKDNKITQLKFKIELVQVLDDDSNVNSLKEKQLK